SSANARTTALGCLHLERCPDHSDRTPVGSTPNEIQPARYDPALSMRPQISEIAPEVNHPGVSNLRRAVNNRVWRKLPRRASFRRDVIAGLNSAINNVPDGMADSILIGVNPLYGLYANLMGPLLGGIFASTQMMMITTTAAA